MKGTVIPGARDNCYFCGGSVLDGWYNTCCRQENGPCGWIELRWSKKGPKRILATWETTKHNRGRGVVKFFREGHDYALIHLGPGGVDTVITDQIVMIDPRHQLTPPARIEEKKPEPTKREVTYELIDSLLNFIDILEGDNVHNSSQ